MNVLFEYSDDTVDNVMFVINAILYVSVKLYKTFSFAIFSKEYHFNEINLFLAILLCKFL